EAYFAQLYLPAKGENDWEVLESVKESVRSIQKKYEGYAKAEPIPMLPLELTTDNFFSYLDRPIQPGQLPIGLDEDSVKPVILNFTKTNHCLLIGQPQRGKTNMIKLLLHQLEKQE